MTNVLMYHDVASGPGEDPGGFTGAGAMRYQVDLARFETHLDRIADAGAGVGLLDAAAGGPGVAITFDDGGASALRAADALERRGWRGHFFVTTGLVGRPRFLDADGVRELARRGHAIGSHSHTHPDYMGRLPAAGILEEWERSASVLAELLGELPAIASVPGGYLSDAVVETAARAGYRVLLTSNPSSKVRRHGTLSVLGRYAIRSHTTAATAAGYAEGSLSACGAQWAQWQVKGLAKRLSPRLYSAITQSSAARSRA